MRQRNIVIWFRIVVLFEILWGAHAWFTWNIISHKALHYSILLVAFMVALMYKSKVRVKLNFSPHCILALTLYLIAVLINNRFSVASIPGVILKLYPIWVVLSDRTNVSANINFISKGIAYLLAPGIILYLILSFIDIPAPIISKGGLDDYTFYNYLILIRPVYGTHRFQSFFLEPGYLGSMLSFLLFSVKYDFRNRHNIVLLVGLIFSFSLAGYITTLLGYLWYLLIERKGFKYYLITVFAIGICYCVAISYNGGNNYINNSIVERLKFDEDRGIVGNNRTGEGTEFYYQQAIENGSIIFGLGVDKVNQINSGSANSGGYDSNIRGAGYKVYFVTYGVLSALLFMLFYLHVAKATCKKNSLAVSGYIFLIIITFWQAAYPQSTSWIYPFVLGMLNYSRS